MRLRHVLLLIGSIAIGACATDQKPPTLPGSINAPPPPIDPAGDSLLTGTVWTWQGTQTNDGAKIVPDAADRYTLEFQPGGRVNVRADCNRGSTSYLLTGPALTFGPIALTKMACPPGSRDTDFVRNLAAVSGQRFQGNELVLTLGGGAGSMRFTTTRQ